MRKRLRKKQGEGEFAGYAFGVSYVLDDVSSKRANEFLDRFVEAIEALGLECGDGRRDWDFRVACANDLKPTEDQRAGVVAWLKSRRELARFDVETLD
ncbi:MAG: DUF469 family protein [Vicinamibacteria bacterium]|nr:DUF469 family protein [Vicinamibacteria bacterium]